MGRSVSYATGATVIAYGSWEGDDSDDFECCVVEDLQNYAPELWPSLRTCDKWLGREDRALLENDHCYMGVSEYCGLVSYWIVPKDDNGHEGLSRQWVDNIAGKFLATFGQYRKIGTASNGESFFEAVR